MYYCSYSLRGPAQEQEGGGSRRSSLQGFPSLALHTPPYRYSTLLLVFIRIVHTKKLEEERRKGRKLACACGMNLNVNVNVEVEGGVII